ncbi:hypothetical protein MKW92_027256 [Papaver armeniacum]|nr:hypothetical protein MKW92_027256 [Papaver armeniacum]
MRFPLSLNIDGMSYEELTALEERIGIVKTGLSKDIILKQLKTRVHTTSADLTQDETDICTVCQDGYENQDKIATLDCKHEYHQDCITKWLVRKNLCPICKGQALKTMEESKKEELLNSNVGTTDGMSFEELTESGERIGKVERGLPKEFISRHLKTRVHHTTSADSMEEETEICTVCQDGYGKKDKVATLDCKHEYHEECITQWLLQKNVCPVCKRQALKAQGPKAMEEC